MRIAAILSAQTALVLGLDLYFDTRLGLWLLYFLPLLGSARIPSVRATLAFALVVSLLILLVGCCKIGLVPWEQIVVPRGLSIYAGADGSSLDPGQTIRRPEPRRRSRRLLRSCSTWMKRLGLATRGDRLLTVRKSNVSTNWSSH